jgi:hypothetical protein
MGSNLYFSTISNPFMSNEIKFKITLAVFFLLVSFTMKAQENRRVFKLNVGDEFQREILVNSNSALQRGDQTLEISSVSSLSKSYIVKSSSPTATNMIVKINKMDNLINSLGKQLYYNSEQKLDSSSNIQKALAYMVNRPADVTIDKYGDVISSNVYKSEFATDTLVAFAGVSPEVFEKGVLLGLFADLTYNTNLKKGFNWTDSVTINKQKLNTKFWVEDVNNNVTIVKFSTTIVSAMLNSNSNGTYVVENATGLIRERLIYSVSTGYQSSAGGILYAVSRSTSISEKTKKIAK